MLSITIPFPYLTGLYFSLALPNSAKHRFANTHRHITMPIHYTHNVTLQNQYVAELCFTKAFPFFILRYRKRYSTAHYHYHTILRLAIQCLYGTTH